MVSAEPLEQRQWPLVPWLGVVALSIVTLSLSSAVAYVLFLRLLHPELWSHGTFWQLWISEHAERGSIRQFYDPVVLFLTVLVRTLAAVGVVLYLKKWLSSATFADLGFTRLTARTAAAAVLSGIAVVFISYFVAAFVDTRLFGSLHWSPYRLSLALFHGPVSATLIIMQGSLVSPVAEELLFRGVLFNGLRQRLSLVTAIFLSAVAFSLYHLRLEGFFSLFTFGVCFALVFVRLKTLWASIICHGTVNAVLFSWAYLAYSGH